MEPLSVDRPDQTNNDYSKRYANIINRKYFVNQSASSLGHSPSHGGPVPLYKPPVTDHEAV